MTLAEVRKMTETLSVNWKGFFNEKELTEYSKTYLSDLEESKKLGKPCGSIIDLIKGLNEDVESDNESESKEFLEQINNHIYSNKENKVDNINKIKSACKGYNNTNKELSADEMFKALGYTKINNFLYERYNDFVSCYIEFEPDTCLHRNINLINFSTYIVESNADDRKKPMSTSFNELKAIEQKIKEYELEMKKGSYKYGF